MKLKVLSFVLAFCLVFGMVSMNAFAATDESTASIIFEAGEGPTPPVDPEEPGTEGPGPGAEGSLVIVSVSDFVFENGSISTNTEYYDIKTAQPNVQVVDLRGTGTGWILDAKLSSFKNSSDSDSLLGATILIANGRLNSLTSMEKAPTAASNIRLVSGGAGTNIMTAGEGKGQGLWVDRFYPESGNPYVQLEVPAGAAELGSHSATITWTLSAVPQD